jgi:hypothetical protein
MPPQEQPAEQPRQDYSSMPFGEFLALAGRGGDAGRSHDHDMTATADNMNTPESAAQPAAANHAVGSATRLPDPYENLPRMSFGLEVGKRLLPGQVLQVDYNTLQKSMEHVGLDTSQDHSALQIRYGEVDRVLGVYYSPQNNPVGADGLLTNIPYPGKPGVVIPVANILGKPHPRIEVNLGGHDPQDAQDTLEHELEHYEEDLAGQLDPDYGPSETRMLAGGVIAADAILSLTSALNNFMGQRYDWVTDSFAYARAIDNVVTRVVDHYTTAGPGVGILPAATAAAAAALYATAKRGGYYGNRSEQAAFATQERVQLPPVVTTLNTTH